MKTLAKTALLVLFLPSYFGAAAQTADASLVHPDEVIKGRGFMVVADRRVFAVMSFLNAAGYDDQPEVETQPVRARVGEMVTAALKTRPDKLRAWRQRYAEWQFPIFIYLDFALSLSPDYPFRRIYVSKQYPEVGRQLKDFPRILSDFWQMAHLEAVWLTVKPEYIAELKKYSFERMESEMAFTWQYLRMPRQDSFVIVNIPNLLDKPNEAIGANYGNSYYSVESPGAISYSINIHEYLHHFINPLVTENFAKQEAKLKDYFNAGKNGPWAKSYQSPVVFTYECLVRALDERIAVKLLPARRDRLEANIAKETAMGLTLTQPFYELLQQFEESGMPFDQFLPELLERLPKHLAASARTLN